MNERRRKAAFAFRYAGDTALERPSAISSPMSTPPPLPPNPSSSPVARAPEKRGWRRLPWWAWTGLFVIFAGLAGIVGAGMFAAGRFVGEGFDIFEEDARIALQRNPTIRARIGTIREMDMDWTATGNAPHPDDFVFELKGDLGGGRVRARFETTHDGERIDQGMLRMNDGKEWPLAPDPGPEVGLDEDVGAEASAQDAPSEAQEPQTDAEPGS